MVDIIVSIQNYVAADTYTVNLYKQGSAIPLASTAIAKNGGSTVVFKNQVSGITYEAEVIHHCASGVNTTKRIIVSQLNSPVCSCPAGYTANVDNTKCIKTTTVSATLLTAYGVADGPDEAAYCREGIRVYQGGYSVDGRGVVEWSSGTLNPYWASLNGTVNGRLNLVGVWNSGDVSEPTGVWIGFSKTINVLTSKIYYVAIAGDNYVRIKINGVVVVDQKQNNIDDLNDNFNYWHCYPVFLSAGVNIIEMEGYNIDSQGCFAAEIYNCTLNELKTVDAGSESILNRLFSTGDQTAFSSFGCGDGYALDLTDEANPVCRKIEYASCQ
jgi:hypothetical protein